MTEKLITPFPIIGETRVWTEQFIQKSISTLPEINWEHIGKLSLPKLDLIPNSPGIYTFVRKSMIEKVSPLKSNSYPLIVYIGKTSNLQARLKDYIDDRRSIERYRSSTRKIRDSVRVMFTEYNDENIDIYYALCSPEKLAMLEDILIQLFDPIFNSRQRLNNDDFDRYEEAITANFMPGVDAYKEDEDITFSDKTEVSTNYQIGSPEPAF